MGKVYRLHKGAEGTGWFTSKIFNDEELDTILTDGKEVSNSIPSPFARIDLVNEAFRWVAQNGIKGNKAQHMLVSDALDIAQLFFYSNKFPELIDIVDYNPKKRISENFGEAVKKHKDLGKTLEIYWEQDANVYNFNKTDKIHFILFNKEIIGATSPKSLFFSAPFKSSFRDEISLQRASGKYFGSKAIQLYEREWDFVEYLYLLAKKSQFADYFPDLYEYLEKGKDLMNGDQRRLLNDLNPTNIDEYDKCHVSGESTNYCTIIDYTLCTAKEKLNSIEDESDFVIVSDFEVEGKKPLVLPSGNFSEKWNYTTKDVKWVPNEYNGKIPNTNTSDLGESKLPVIGDQYPWLSEGNFLAASIIELPYNIDSGKFVTGESNKGKKYLLPLTDTFLKYYDVSNVPEMLEIEELSQGTIVVGLKIKTRGGLVKFEKKYKTNEKIKLNLYVAILPFIKVSIDEFPIEYTIGMIDNSSGKNKNIKYSIRCLIKGKDIEVSDPVIRTPQTTNLKSIYQKAKQSFDALEISLNNEISGIIIPKMQEYIPNNETSHYAIDFGTTNTHIEYTLDSNVEKAYSIEKSLPIMTSLLDKNTDQDPLFTSMEDIFQRELIPFTVGKGSENEISFPVRTALVYNRTTNKADKNFEIFKQVNNYLFYEHMHQGSELKLETNLKWEDLHVGEHLRNLEAYIEHLVLMIKHKSLTNNIALKNLKLTWLYPVSMSKYHKGRLSKIWADKLVKVFGSEFIQENVRSIPESIGPYYYYYKKRAISGLTLSVDIGGGSTDVSVYNEGEVKLISSVRFAGDAIFGDGYGKMPSRNGFVNLFINNALEYIESDDDADKRILDDILNRESSKDFSSYLFALSKKNGRFDYSTLIKNHRQIKLVVLLFHAALAYYIAKMMKNRGVEIPKNLLFSGTASKTVYILDSSQDLKQISNLYRFIFDKVYDSKTESEITCELSEIPKELTCKGALLSLDVSDQEYEKMFWLGGAEVYDKNVDLENLSKSIRYKEIMEEKAKFFESEIGEFYKILDEYNQDYNLEDYYGITREAYKLFEKTRGKQLVEDLRLGINKTINRKYDAPIEESLFFFPLIGELSKLAFELSKDKAD